MTQDDERTLAEMELILDLVAGGLRSEPVAFLNRATELWKKRRETLPFEKGVEMDFRFVAMLINGWASMQIGRAAAKIEIDENAIQQIASGLGVPHGRKDDNKQEGRSE